MNCLNVSNGLSEVAGLGAHDDKKHEFMLRKNYPVSRNLKQVSIKRKISTQFFQRNVKLKPLKLSFCPPNY